MARNLSEALDAFTDHVAFERLCCQVLDRSGYAGIDPQGQGRRDGGKDALLDTSAWGTVVFHFSLRKDWKQKLEEDLATVERNGIPCDRFVFVTSRPLTALEKDRAKARISERLGTTADVFDQARLEIAVSGDDALRQRYFPDVAAGTAIDSLAATLRGLVDQGLVVPAATQLDAIPLAVRTAMEAVAEAAFSDAPDDAVAAATRLVRTMRAAQNGISHLLDIVAAALLHNGLGPQADAMWTLAIELDPTNAAARFNFAVAAEYDARNRRYGPGYDAAKALRRYDDALACATTTAERVRCWENMAVIHVKRDELAAGIALLEQAHAADPEDLSVQFNLASFATGARRRALLEAQLGGVHDVHARICLAADLAGEDDERAAALIDGIEEVPAFAQAQDLLARTALQLGDEARARRVAERQLESFEDLARAHETLASVATRQGDLPVVIAAYETAIALEPDDLQIRFDFALALQKLEDPRARRHAVDLLTRTATTWPDDARVHGLLGLAAFDVVPEQAKEAFERVLELDPTNVEAEFNLGAWSEDWGTRTGQPAQGDVDALRRYERVLALDPDYLPAIVNTGTCLLRLGAAKAALPHLERAVGIDPVHPVALGNLGNAYGTLGRRDEAIACFRRLLEADPTNEYASHNLAALHGIAVPTQLPQR